MEDFLFKGYIKFQKNNKDDFLKEFFQLPPSIIILLLCVIISVIISIVCVFTPTLHKYTLCAVISEIIFLIVSYSWVERYCLIGTDDYLKNYQKYCYDIKQYFIQIGFNCTEENINNIIIRIKNKIEALDNQRKLHIEKMEKWFQVIIFPIILAIFGKLLNDLTEFSVILEYAFNLFVIVVTFVIIIAGLYAFLNFFNKRKIEQLKCFAKDLQGILDTQFDNKMILENNADENL